MVFDIDKLIWKNLCSYLWRIASTMKFFSVLLSVILRASFEKFEFWTKIHEWTFYCGTSQIYRKRDNKSVKKQGVKNKIYKTLSFFQNNNKSTITKMLLHFQLINSNWIDTFAFLKSSLEMILLSYYLQKISLPF